MRVLATYNIKGGVGKTTTAVNLAYLAARAGARTLLCDLDPQGAATYCFRIKPKVKGGGKRLVRGKRPLERSIRETDYEGLDLLPADFSYRHLDLILDGPKHTRRLARRIRPLADHYDYLFLDCAPSISLVSEAVFAAVDALLVPTIPTTLSQRTLKQLGRHLRREQIDVRVFPFHCMVDRRKALHRQICEAKDKSSFVFLDASIPYSSTVEQMSARRAPLAIFSPRSAATRAYAALWAEIEARLWKTIVLLRHGKSDWNADYDGDHERPLAGRGVKAARRMGRFLAGAGQVPERVLCSSAVRAIETVRLAGQAGDWKTTVDVVPEFYAASAGDVLQRVMRESDDVSSLLLVGHEPSWSEVASVLIGGGELRFPTAAMARIDLHVTTWSSIGPACGELAWFLPPRFLKGDS